MRYFILLLLLLCSCIPNRKPGRQTASGDVRSDAVSNSKLEIPYLGRSENNEIVEHMGYTLSYNSADRIPNWVAYELSQFDVIGTVPRSGKFMPDPDLKGPQAQDSDYKHSGWDRGHMAPAGDMKWSTQAMAESFYLTNVCPQNRNLNRGDWKELEELARRLSVKYKKVYIVCGPIVTDNKHKSIGGNKVTVPDGFYKALLVHTGENYSAVGFVMPNEAGNRKLAAYVCTVDSLEKMLGMDLFCKLPDSIEALVERDVVLSDWGI